MSLVYEGVKRIHEAVRKAISDSMEKSEGQDLRVQYLILNGFRSEENLSKSTLAILNAMKRNGKISNDEFSKYSKLIAEEEGKTGIALNKLDASTPHGYDDTLKKAHNL